MPPDPPVTVSVSRRFDAPPERVFDAFLEPAVAAQFLFATPTGQMVRAEIEPRIGGRFNFADRRDGQDVEHVGAYLELDRPRRLAFSFVVPAFSDQPATVAIDIAPDRDGSQLTLTHEGVLADYAERTKHGWGMILDALDRALNG